MKREKGIRQLPDGRWRVYGRANGQYFEHFPPFPADTLIGDMRTWRRQERVRIELGMREQAREQLRRAEAEPEPTGFRADAAVYLKAVKGMPSFRDQERYINEWTELFGDRPRSSIRSVEIRTKRDSWLVNGPRTVCKKVNGKSSWVKVYEPLSPHSVNLRLRALSNLWTVLDGKRAPNPVREVPECDEDEGQVRAIPVPVVRAIFAQMRPSKTKARLEVIAWCGLPHVVVMKLTPDDINLEARTLWIAGRKKGLRAKKVRKGRLVPLTPDGVRALKAFIREDAWGDFSTDSALKSFKLAAGKIGIEKVRAYDLRHTFGTETLAATEDLRITQKMLNLSTPDLVERYGRAAVDPVLAAAAKKLGRKLGKAKTAVIR